MHACLSIDCPERRREGDLLGRHPSFAPRLLTRKESPLLFAGLTLKVSTSVPLALRWLLTVNEGVS